MERLRKHFQTYLGLAARMLQRQSPSRDSLTLIPGRFALLDEIEALERGQEFDDLISAFRDETAGCAASKSVFWAAEEAIRSFLRRTHVYTRLVEWNELALDQEWNRLDTALSQDPVATYYVPLTHAYFEPREVVFPGFKIVKFTADELENLLNEPGSTTYYPESAVDCEYLSKWPLLVAEGPWEDPILARWDTPEVGLAPTDHKYPRPLEQTLKKLLLCEWHGEIYDRGHPDLEKLTHPTPQLACVFTRPKSPFEPVPPSPSLSSMPIDCVTIEGMPTEVPWISVTLDQGHVDRVESDLRRAERTLAKALALPKLEKSLRFSLDLALRAQTSSGPERFLFHLITIESLVGGSGQQVQETIARRLGEIHFSNERSKKSIRDEIKELYTYRSNIVHGNLEFRDKPLDHSHSIGAERYAISTIWWWVSVLELLTEGVNDNTLRNVSREDVLAVLDLSPSQRALGSFFARDLTYAGLKSTSC